ncbi:MAG: hypothetical protein JXO22_15085, partial [Phycisphaerae bacterium]|nr:hypothetical protein [Phycisphaerae bacterium]
DNPIAPGVGYQPPEDYRADMMHSGNYAHDDAIGKHQQPWDSTYRFYSEHTAASFNRDKGVRRGLFGEYFFDIPMKNRYTFLTPDKQPIGKAKVELFVGRGRGYTGCGMNAEPNFTGQSDAAGVYQLERSPWDHVFIWGNNGVTMFRVTPEGGKPMIGFVPLGHYNLEYWRGNAWIGNYTVVLQNIK